MSCSVCQALILVLTCSSLADAEIPVKGVFAKRITTPGYHLIRTIPEGAKSINVTDLANTQSFLAVRLQNGTCLFNDNFNINDSGRYRGAGTYFTYIRHNEYTAETFYAPGPLNSPIDVMLLYNRQQPQILYQFELPEDPKTSTAPNLDAETSLITTQSSSTISENIMMGDEIRSSTSATPRKKRKRKYFWKSIGFSKCSKTCAGGVTYKRFMCFSRRLRNRSSINNTEPIHDRYCSRVPKPAPVIRPCNSEPCRPQWVPDKWSGCSVTCGNGTRTRTFKCVQEVSSKLSVNTNDDNCPAELPMSVPSQEPCFMPDCNIYTTPKSSVTTKHYSSTRWKAEEWSPCSVTCGNGTRKRVVTCINYGRNCNLAQRPNTEESCNMGTCPDRSILNNEIPEALTDKPWLYSAWPDKCPSECGVGIISRRLYCEDNCDERIMPTMNRTCYSSETCGQWFVGPWTECSSSCEMGFTTREVVCISRFLGVPKVIKPFNCNAERPEDTKVCVGPPCNATWFMSDWSKCSQSCGGGIQEREVRCIGPDDMPINAGELECNEEKRPVSKRNCNETPCDGSNTKEDLDCQDMSAECASIRNGDPEQKCKNEFYKRECCKACRYHLFISSRS